MDEEKIKHHVIFGDDVGYGNPPEQSRFKKGQSGNPKGRPKKTPSNLSLPDQRTLSTVMNVANRIVPVRENGEVKYMNMMEVAVNALFAKSAKGDSRALATLLALMQKGDVARALHIKEQNVFWQNRKNEGKAKLSDAQARGEPMPKLLPHPDDIIIDHEEGPRFVGPFIEQEQIMLDETLRLRDLLFLQSSLDRRSKKRPSEPLIKPGAAELLAMVLERFIPARLRLSNGEWLWRTTRADIIPKSELLKLVFEGWRKLGWPLPRGLVFPEMETMKRLIERAFELARDIRSLPYPDDMPRGEWERSAARVIESHFPQ